MSLCKSKLDAASFKRCNNTYYLINENKESGNEKDCCLIVKKWSDINKNSDKNIIFVNFAVLCRKQ